MTQVSTDKLNLDHFKRISQKNEYFIKPVLISSIKRKPHTYSNNILPLNNHSKLKGLTDLTI